MDQVKLMLKATGRFQVYRASGLGPKVLSFQVTKANDAEVLQLRRVRW